MNTAAPQEKSYTKQRGDRQRMAARQFVLVVASLLASPAGRKAIEKQGNPDLTNLAENFVAVTPDDTEDVGDNEVNTDEIERLEGLDIDNIDAIGGSYVSLSLLMKERSLNIAEYMTHERTKDSIKMVLTHIGGIVDGIDFDSRDN